LNSLVLLFFVWRDPRLNWWLGTKVRLIFWRGNQWFLNWHLIFALLNYWQITKITRFLRAELWSIHVSKSELNLLDNSVFLSLIQEYIVALPWIFCIRYPWYFFNVNWIAADFQVPRSPLRIKCIVFNPYLFN